MTRGIKLDNMKVRVLFCTGCDCRQSYSMFSSNKNGKTVTIQLRADSITEYLHGICRRKVIKFERGERLYSNPVSFSQQFVIKIFKKFRSIKNSRGSVFRSSAPTHCL